MNFFWHAYDTFMMIIVTKTRIIIDVVGSYFYDKKLWQKMGFSSWSGLLLLDLALVFLLKRKGWCSKVEISISLSWEPRYQSSRRYKQVSNICTHTNNQALAPNALKGLSIASRSLARVRSDKDKYKEIKVNKIQRGIFWVFGFIDLKMYNGK